MTTRKGIDWGVQPLGKVVDRVIAKQLDVCVSVVRIARWRRGIPSFWGANKKIDWSAVELGARSDGDIARELGISRVSVAGARRRAKLPPFKHSSQRKGLSLTGIDWEDVDFSNKTDAAIARELLCSQNTVKKWRRLMGIPDERSTRRHCACGSTFDVPLRHVTRKHCSERCKKGYHLYGKIGPKLKKLRRLVKDNIHHK